MTNEELNAKLYEKMFVEQEKYRGKAAYNAAGRNFGTCL